MEDLRTVISKISLPIELPESAFIAFENKYRLADMAAILGALPPQVKEHVDPELTVTNISETTFALPLKDGRYLFVKLKDREINGLEIISRY
jgi:hypothetical protein